MKTSLSYVVAAYNEEKIIGEKIEKLYKYLEKNFEDFEIILVDDCSLDNTLNIMESFCKKHSERVYVLKNHINLNFGTSILRGINFAQKDYVIYNAADFPLKIEDTILCINKIVESNADLLVLERESYNPVAWRKITSKVNNILIKILFPKLIKGNPVLNFVQIFKKDHIKKIRPLARSPIFVWPEMIFRAKLLNLKVENLKIKINEEVKRSGSFGKPHDIIWGLYDMFRFRIRLWMGKI